MQRAYFIGIGGIGMSALARYFKANGIEVAGYDRVSTGLTDQLAREGMMVHFTDDISAIPEAYRSTQGTLVVYTPAVPPLHSELRYFRDNHFDMVKRARALGMIIADKKSIAVAGTHGKTTISTMLSHILTVAGVKTSAFLGGISKNTGSNFRFEPGSHYIVVEADEFDRSFLNLNPQMAVITATDADHLDIYGSAEALEDTFNQFASQVKPCGVLLLKKGLKINYPRHVRRYNYSLSGDADFFARDISREGFRYHFSLRTPGGTIDGISLQVYGRVNLENAVAAGALAWLAGAGEEGVREGLEGYTGVRRRFDVIIEQPGCLFIDDYAHHPEELKAFISSVREALPGKRLSGVFQPHLYTRTRDFAAGFARSLSALDDVIILDIYPAREEPIAGVGPELILDNLTNTGEKIACSKEQLFKVVGELNPEVLLTMGAGDIDQMVDPLKNLLLDKCR
ncbi:MAG TPA: UDP-N-acetylmuramate--L-alanine ligase [Bacteroidales bacterium]|nr:UDP-N-acetylmuramate--L-alanine ligase [Bacteroidales bacterium]